MRFIKYLLLAVILIAIVVLAVANRGPVTLRLLPDGLSMFGQRSIELPMHLVGLALILTGMILGYIFEWLREQQGLATGEELMTIEDVKGSDGAWLLSSTSLAAPITHLDEHELPVDAELTARFERVLKGGI